MFKRKVYDKLLDWKQSSDGHSALLIEGARRIGKTTVAEEFAKNEYSAYVMVDFSLVSDEFKQVFLDTRTDLDSFFLYLSAAYGVRLITRETLIIFDEVQLFPQAREFIKHLVADGRYDYLETGSLISLKSNVQGILLPSEEDAVQMSPMDFEEFLWAMGEEPLAQVIRAAYMARKPLPESLHRKAMRLWNEYTLVGGMPQVVAAYAEGRDMVAADKVKRGVLRLYRNDIEKYGGSDAKRIKAVFDAAPGLLAKHEKKLVYTEVEEGSRARDFMMAFAWLREAATVNLCTLSTDPSLGLALSEDDATLKCYMGDTGLLSTLAFSAAGGALPEVYRRVLLGDASVNEGMLTENAVAQQLVASGHELHFYSKWSNKAADRMEIDFLLVLPFADSAMKPRVTPVEVKSGKRYSTVSLEKFRKKFGKRVGESIVLHPNQLRQDDSVVRFPLYMAHCL